MKRHNSGLIAVRHEVPPNPIYEAYRSIFDSIFVKEHIQDHEYESLYIFDRFQYSSERTLLQLWTKVSNIHDPLMEDNFKWQPYFGVQEKELLSFLLIDIPGSGKIVHIVGDMGTGKSTFVRFMFQRYLPKQKFFENGEIWYIDLLKVMRTADEYTYAMAARIVLKALRERLVDSLGELCRHWDDDEILRFVSQRAATLGANRVVLVIDNIDQFPLTFQSHLARFCQSLANTATCTIVLALRYFNLHCFTPPAQSNVGVRYIIEQRPPALNKVIEHRLRYYLNNHPNLRQERILRIAANNVTITFSHATEFVEAFITILLHPHVREALNNMANHNIRLGLIWALDFLSSRNLDLPLTMGQILRSWVVRGQVKSIDEYDTFILALGYCNHDIYIPAHSRLENLFSANLKNPIHDTFIKYRALKYCYENAQGISGAHLRDHLSRFGYSDIEIDSCIDQLMAASRALLKSQDGDRFNDLKSLHISPAGCYYLEHLITHLYYLQIVSDDVLLPDNISPNRGSKLDRFQNLIGMIEHIGKAELADTIHFFESMRVSSNKKNDKQKFMEVYGDTPLCVRMLENLERFLSGKRRTTESVSGTTNISSLSDTVKELVDSFNGSYQGILSK